MIDNYRDLREGERERVEYMKHRYARARARVLNINVVEHYIYLEQFINMGNNVYQKCQYTLKNGRLTNVWGQCVCVYHI